MSNDSSRDRVRAIVRDYYDRGDFKGWFEEVYATAGGDPVAVPWEDAAPNPNLVRWLDREKIAGNARRALVVGCGLGDDAEELARRGFDVTAFDISPTAINWCTERYPNSKVKYVAADLLAPPDAWRRAFDFVLEIHTLQTMRGQMRSDAVAGVGEFVAQNGELLIICRGRDESEPTGDLPWPLLKSELDELRAQGLREISFEDYMDEEDPPVRRFRARFRRDAR
jgi:SAM-dependent methyltransferase